MVETLVTLRILLLGVGMAAAAPALAADHGIAMHGQPKYGSDFSHFDYVEPAAPKGGRLRLAKLGSFDSLNPFIPKGVAPAGIRLTFESLLKRSDDEPFSLYGLIAERVEMAADRSWIAFTLNPAARFADGTPVTVEDVIFSWRTLKDKGRPNHRLYYREVDQVEVPAPGTVRFHFRPGGNRELPLLMALMTVLPRHWFESHDFQRASLMPIPGSGPYGVETVDPGRAITYRRRADYWGRDLAVNRGFYNFDRIEIDFYRDKTAAFEAFKAGAYDLRFELDPARWNTAYGFADGQPDLVRLETRHGRPVGMRAFAFNTRLARFADPKVRRALGRAFDFAWTNRVLFHGAYKRTRSYFENSPLAARGAPDAAERALLEPWRAKLPPEVFQALPKPEPGPIRAALRRAAADLKQAGWVVRDGRLVNAATGAAMAFEILLADPAEEKVALGWARNLARLGVRARVRTADAAQYELRRRSFDFEVILTHWSQSLSPGSEQWYYWGSAQADQAVSRNYPGIREPAVDAMIGHLTGARTRPALWTAARALDRILRAGHYVVPLYYSDSDRLAYWRGLGRPATAPLYGYEPTQTWWSFNQE